MVILDFLKRGVSFGVKKDLIIIPTILVVFIIYILTVHFINKRKNKKNMGENENGINK